MKKFAHIKSTLLNLKPFKASKSVLKFWVKYITLFLMYGTIYYIIESIYKRQPSDLRMFILSGCIGISIGLINILFERHTDFILQCIVGMLIATLSEAIGGYYWNIECGLNIWNYYPLPFTFVGGQVNLIFSVFWFFLSGLVIIVDDMLRWKLYEEISPRYYIHGKLVFKL